MNESLTFRKHRAYYSIPKLDRKKKKKKKNPKSLKSNNKILKISNTNLLYIVQININHSNNWTRFPPTPHLIERTKNNISYKTNISRILQQQHHPTSTPTPNYLRATNNKKFQQGN